MKRTAKRWMIALFAVALPLALVPAVGAVEDGEPATLSGCLTQAANAAGDDVEMIEGLWVLTSTEDGSRTLLQGLEELERHDAKHEVEVEGVWVLDRVPDFEADHDRYLRVSEVRHVDAECEAPTNADDRPDQPK